MVCPVAPTCLVELSMVLDAVNAEAPAATIPAAAIAIASLVLRIRVAPFGSPADRVGPVALRPQLAPGLPLSWTLRVSWGIRRSLRETHPYHPFHGCLCQLPGPGRTSCLCVVRTSFVALSDPI